MSSSTVLELFQPAVGCCANDAVLAVCQPVRAHGGTCSRCAAALGLPERPLLQVCHAPRRLPPAVHRSHFSDRAFCTRMSGSCLGSSITTRPTVGTISTDVGALGERAALGVLMRAVGAQQRLCVKDGHMCMASSRAPKAAGITHPCHMHVWTRWAGEVSRKMSDVSVPRCDAIGVARLGRFPGQQCDRTSKLECCELTVVVSSRIHTHKILGCGGAALWGRGCERPFRHSYTKSRFIPISQASETLLVIAGNGPFPWAFLRE